MEPGSHFVLLQVIPKDVATLSALQKAVQGNVLFSELEKDELTDVLDAMFLKKVKAGEVDQRRP